MFKLNFYWLVGLVLIGQKDLYSVNVVFQRTGVKLPDCCIVKVEEGMTLRQLSQALKFKTAKEGIYKIILDNGVYVLEQDSKVPDELFTIADIVMVIDDISHRYQPRTKK